MPEDWPPDTIAAEFYRDTPEDPWRLCALYLGDAQRHDDFRAGWNNDAEANLYVLTGSGPSPPHLYQLVDPDPTTSAVWSSVGWATTVGPMADGAYEDLPADPVALGYQVLDALPDIPLQEVERLLYCETCGEEQDGDYLCEHVWWCDTDEEWRGALYDAPPGPCGNEGCWECFNRTPQASA